MWMQRCRWRRQTAMANGVDNEVRPSHVWVQRQQQQTCTAQHSTAATTCAPLIQTGNYAAKDRSRPADAAAAAAFLHVPQLMRLVLGLGVRDTGQWIVRKWILHAVASMWKWSSDPYALNIAPTSSSFGCCQLHLHFLASSCWRCLCCNALKKKKQITEYLNMKHSLLFWRPNRDL